LFCLTDDQHLAQPYFSEITIPTALPLTKVPGITTAHTPIATVNSPLPISAKANGRYKHGQMAAKSATSQQFSYKTTFPSSQGKQRV
jgi:hypothetical protein